MTKRTEREWRRLVRDFESGDQSRRDFCAARGLSMGTLDYWRRRFRGASAGRLLEVEVAGVPDSGVAVPAGVTITWPNGVVVAFSAPVISVEVLERLHRAFGGDEPCSR